MKQTFQILILLLSTIFISCGGGGNTKGPVEEVEEDVAVEPSMIEEEMEEASIAEAEAGLIKATSLKKHGPTLVPNEKDKKKFDVLKRAIKKDKAHLAIFLDAGKNKAYPEMELFSTQYLSDIFTGVLDKSAADFAKARDLDRKNFDKELNWVGLALGYSLIDTYGDQKAKFFDFDLPIRKLISEEIITDTKLIRYKVYEKELTSKMSPAQGQGNIKVTVDGSGNIFLNEQKMGKAVEKDGIFFMDIDKSMMMPSE